jgi:hypothetical protein
MINENTTEIINEFVPKKNIKKYAKTEATVLLDYKEYLKKNVILKDFKIPELKSIAKQNNLLVGGTKPILIERLENHFKKTGKVIRIQAIFRGWILRQSIKLRGPALKDRKLCVNDTDFVSMEPLNEVPNEYFYSYKDSAEFVYGFNITSLIQLMKQTSKITNPYNREKINGKILDDIRRLYRLTFIVYPEFKKENESPVKQVQQQSNTVRRSSSTYQSDPRNTITVYSNPDQQNRIERMYRNRSNSISQRLNDLFSEIDQLGNYTQVSWFTSLSLNSYIRLFRSLYDIWYYRSQLSRETRQRICPLPAPFDTTIERNAVRPLTTEDIQKMCVEIFENLIFMGVDNDSRQLGAFHSLTALTVVSLEARTAMPWLYESINNY